MKPRPDIAFPVDSAPLGARRGLPFAGHGVTGPRIDGLPRVGLRFGAFRGEVEGTVPGHGVTGPRIGGLPQVGKSRGQSPVTE